MPLKSQLLRLDAEKKFGRIALDWPGFGQPLPNGLVILFGSHARGEAGADSDVDFLVVEPVVENRLKEWERLRRALRDFPAPVDIVVLDELRAERRAKVPGTMVHHALRDGPVLAHA